MNYNETQFAELSRFEDNFRTALSTPSGWTRRIPIPDQRRIKAIYTEATGERIPYTIGCGHCLLSLLKKAGKLYFEDKKAQSAKTSPDKEGREAKAAEVKAEKAVETAQKPRKKSEKKDGEKTPAKTKKAAKTEK